jgi:hypothetical protein
MQIIKFPELTWLVNLRQLFFWDKKCLSMIVICFYFLFSLEYIRIRQISTQSFFTISFLR